MTTTQQPASAADVIVVGAGPADPDAAVHPRSAPARHAVSEPDRPRHDPVVNPLATVAPAA